ncbi:hypothetical protein BTN50_1940 [Candidatus Enterovibrio altilux]|uniref:Uncharacterized protein n=1 Tax=Candidatus Enterovibrio altilux TaxID=1927128 RepID=A0A291BBM6_9GAMM|nr:hypothetical protein BTN50_1940 [Candidatus Enterovibrio luxaltus]
MTPDNITKPLALNKRFPSFHKKIATFGERNHPRNLAVSDQKLHGSNKR